MTTWLKSFFSKFEDSVAFKGANDYLKKKWAKSTKDSSKAGTKTHKQIEDYLLDSLIIPSDIKALTAVKWLEAEWISGKLIPEVKLCDSNLGLAGTCDVIIVNKDKTLTLVDWKTNKEIKTVGYKGALGRGACSEIPDSNFYHYLIQLSTYAYMLKLRGYTVNECILVHLREEGHITYRFEPDYNLIQRMLEEKNGYETITRRVNEELQKTTPTDKSDII